MSQATSQPKSSNQCFLLDALKWIGRSLLLLLVLTVGLSLIAKILDLINVVQRALAILSPYARTIPWILMTGLAAYVLHLPKVLDTLLSLMDRVEELPGGWRLRSHGISEEEMRRIAEYLVAKEKGPDEVEKVHSEHEREDYRKRLAMERHIRDMGGTTRIPARYEAIQWQFFDGCFRCGDEIIFMLVKRPLQRDDPHINLIGVVHQFDEIKAQLRRSKLDRISLHVLFCADENYPFPQDCEGDSRRLPGIRTDVMVYFYLFDKNDVITSKKVVS